MVGIDESSNKKNIKSNIKDIFFEDQSDEKSFDQNFLKVLIITLKVVQNPNEKLVFMQILRSIIYVFISYIYLTFFIFANAIPFVFV